MDKTVREVSDCFQTERGRRQRSAQHAIILVWATELMTFSSHLSMLMEKERATTQSRRILDEYFVPQRNVIYERALFNSRKQEPGEPVEEFITALHTLVEYCDYGNLRDQMVRDRIVVGLANAKLSERLQLDRKLTLDTAVFWQARQDETG